MPAGDGQSVVIFSAHVGSDADTFPSKRYRYTLEMWQGAWQVAGEKSLGRDAY